MPLVAHNNLPSFSRLSSEGIKVLEPHMARHQDIRELHIGLLNMMPDKALAATERQFFRLIGESNPIAQFYVHPFTLDELPHSPEAGQYIKQYYEPYEKIKDQGLDALIITGANVSGPELSSQPFWKPLKEVSEWAYENVTSTLYSCLATHAAMEFQYGIKRRPQDQKVWGVFEHYLVDRTHPLVNDVNTRFDVPHSRWNEISSEDFEQAGLYILVKSDQGFVHLATSPDGFRKVFFQGHPEYDTISLLKEYKRDLILARSNPGSQYPPFPENYLGIFDKAILNEYKFRTNQFKTDSTATLPFPEILLKNRINNTWHDTAVEVVGNWMGLIYQLTHKERQKPFMDGIDPDNPLGLVKDSDKLQKR
jgi:homoserine O-succinyltransferase